MPKLDYAGTLSHLMGRLGERVVVKVASATNQGPPRVVELAGTLAAGWSSDEELALAEDVVQFRFEEHDAAFYLDGEFFRAARVDSTGEWLEVNMSTVGIEVTAPMSDDADADDPERDG